MLEMGMISAIEATGRHVPRIRRQEHLAQHLLGDHCVHRRGDVPDQEQGLGHLGNQRRREVEQQTNFGPLPRSLFLLYIVMLLSVWLLFVRPIFEEQNCMVILAAYVMIDTIFSSNALTGVVVERINEAEARDKREKLSANVLGRARASCRACRTSCSSTTRRGRRREAPAAGEAGVDAVETRQGMARDDLPAC